jgi:hypothetical protein
MREREKDNERDRERKRERERVIFLEKQGGDVVPDTW